MACAACKNPQGDFGHATLSEGPTRWAGVVAGLPERRESRLLAGLVKHARYYWLRWWRATAAAALRRHGSANRENKRRPPQLREGKTLDIGRSRLGGRSSGETFEFVVS